MDKAIELFKKLWNRFNQRWIGFYLMIPVVIITFVIPFVYMSGFLRTDYMSAWNVVIPFVAILTFALAFFKPTARYAPLATFAAELLGLLVFVKTSYMHLTTAFFGGINGNVFVQAGFSFSFCALAYVINIIICVTATFFCQYRGEKTLYAKREQPAGFDEIAETDVEEADADNEVVRVYDEGTRRFVIIKYDKSFTARLIQSEETEKNYYSELKNEILSYKGVKSRISWKHETFRAGRKALIKLRFRGKILSVYFALPAQEYEESKYKVEDVSEKDQYKDTPCLYRIKNDRRLRYAKELIAGLMSANGLEKTEAENIDYVSQFPYETTEALVERKLIKKISTEEETVRSERADVPFNGGGVEVTE